MRYRSARSVPGSSVLGSPESTGYAVGDVPEGRLGRIAPGPGGEGDPAPPADPAAGSALFAFTEAGVGMSSRSLAPLASDLAPKDPLR